MKIGFFFLITIHCAFPWADVRAYEKWIHAAAELAVHEPGDTLKNYEENLEEMVHKNLIWESKDIQKEVHNIVQGYHNCLLKKEYGHMTELKAIVDKQYEKAKCHYQPSSYFRDLINLQVYSDKRFSKIDKKQILFDYIAKKNTQFTKEKLKGKEIIKFFEFHFANAFEFAHFGETRGKVYPSIFQAYVEEHITRSDYFKEILILPELKIAFNELIRSYESLLSIWNEKEITIDWRGERPQNFLQNYEKTLTPLPSSLTPHLSIKPYLKDIQNHFTGEAKAPSFDSAIKKIEGIKKLFQDTRKIAPHQASGIRKSTHGAGKFSGEWQSKVKENLKNLENNRMRPAQSRKGILNKNSFFSGDYIKKFYRH